MSFHAYVGFKYTPPLLGKATSRQSHPRTTRPASSLKSTLKKTRNSSVSAAPWVSVLIMAMERRVWLKRRPAAAATRVAERVVEGRKKPIVDCSNRVEAMARRIPRWNILKTRRQVGVCGHGCRSVGWAVGNEMDGSVRMGCRRSTRARLLHNAFLSPLCNLLDQP